MFSNSALRNSGYAMPAGRVTVNLSPADLKKDPGDRYSNGGFRLALVRR